MRWNHSRTSIKVVLWTCMPYWSLVRPSYMVLFSLFSWVLVRVATLHIQWYSCCLSHSSLLVLTESGVVRMCSVYFFCLVVFAFVWEVNRVLCSFSILDQCLGIDNCLHVWQFVTKNRVLGDCIPQGLVYISASPIRIQYNSSKFCIFCWRKYEYS